jgi:hypothetical protein
MRVLWVLLEKEITIFRFDIWSSSISFEVGSNDLRCQKLLVCNYHLAPLYASHLLQLGVGNLHLFVPLCNLHLFCLDFEIPCVQLPHLCHHMSSRKSKMRTQTDWTLYDIRRALVDRPRNYHKILYQLIHNEYTTFGCHRKWIL